MQSHTAAWYDRLATTQAGYYYPWQSQLGAWHGEDFYLALVHQHLYPEADVLDVACGHGEVALTIAPHCRSILGYDRTAAWVTLAQHQAHARGLTNATFVCYDSSPAMNNGHAHLPVSDASIDLLICSKGPLHWVADAQRIARPGAVILMVVPDARPRTPWHTWLPPSLQWQAAADPHWARPTIEQRLADAGLTLHSWWSFDVPELLPNPEQLYTLLTWGYAPHEVPALAAIRPVLERIFTTYGEPGGVAVRQRRYVWKAVVPADRGAASA